MRLPIEMFHVEQVTSERSIQTSVLMPARFKRSFKSRMAQVVCKCKQQANAWTMQAHTMCNRGGRGRHRLGVEIPVPSISLLKNVAMGLSSSTSQTKNAIRANVLDGL